jgi:hypothetical protein
MNTYTAFYKGKSIDVQAETSFAAQQKAANLLHAKRSYEVTIVLATKDGKPIIHNPAEL